jgi:hypothetical protein
MLKSAPLPLPDDDCIKLRPHASLRLKLLSAAEIGAHLENIAGGVSFVVRFRRCQ